MVKEIDIWLKIFNSSDTWIITHQDDNHIELEIEWRSGVVDYNFKLFVNVYIDSSRNIISANRYSNHNNKIYPFDKSTIIELFGQDKWDSTELEIIRNQKLNQILLNSD